MTDLDVADLRARYDAQLRTVVPDPLPAGLRVDRDGPLLRFIGYGNGGGIGYRDLGGIEGAELDELIARQVRVFAERGEAFEWKLHGHDLPVDLSERLLAQGFLPEDPETVVIAPVAKVAGEVPLPDQVSVREVSARTDLERIGVMEDAIWHDGRAGWLADSLEAERAADPDAIAIVVAESAEEFVCAGWVRFVSGTDFATFWGGGTLPDWRRRGIYHALVAYRANLAAARGFRLLQVDASSESRPILQRMGFVAVTTTTPYVWTLPATIQGGVSSVSETARIAQAKRPGGSMTTEGLTTARLDLAPLTATDAEDLFPVFDDPALGRWTGETPPADVETLRRRFAAWEAGPSESSSERWLNWTIRRRDDGRAVGHLQSTVVGDTASIAWVVGTALQGQGFATEAAKALVTWLRETGIATVEASIHPGNVPSQVVASRAGLHLTDRIEDGEVVWSFEAGAAS